PVRSDGEVAFARQKGRELAAALGFGPVDLTFVATAISELTRNVVLYAKRGRIVLKGIEQNGKLGIMVVARDDGPGIPNVARAMESGFSTSCRLGLGLAGERLRHTRGVVMSVAWFQTGERTMAWLGVGNVEGVLQRGSPHGSPASETLLVRSGLVGSHLPPLRASVLSVNPGDTLIVATDGI